MEEQHVEKRNWEMEKRRDWVNWTIGLRGNGLDDGNKNVRISRLNEFDVGDAGLKLLIIVE
ncbi:hypothetical protein KY284_035507 [Solanum tuberosum]|nr:hypothetical protein KY284_035501 [Solanum tuberosum]KAH0632721.1 hypothetical protein KY284_035507 [Solanum tuberosum]